MTKKDSGIASVLAFEKRMVPSDGYMYETRWDTRQEEKTPIRLAEKSVRGTISNRLKNAVKNDPAKLNAEVEKANLQTVDSASLSMECDTLTLCFTLKFLPVQQPSACNNEEHYQKINSMIQAYKDRYGFTELAKRYAFNIANGRFLWRNRVGAERIEIIVTAKEPEVQWVFNAYDYGLRDFDDEDTNVLALANCIADALCGTKPYLFLEVEANVLLGRGQEVYPSEELVLDKKGKKSKILYAVNDTAAMHSQKLGNALRTIDTWYPEYDDVLRPIAIETYGAVTNLGKAYRTGTSKKDFYTLFDKYSAGEALGCEEDEHYVMAVLVRGGVFGQSGKE
ncbi:type I-F CRISPR-associated protein Csy3 [Megasphaera sp. SW808]|uniref:type I-F CRISPR-associated protein Csy3 n=1 Tax=Megasphaera sp. SW808 TaxID=2530045 RepID=UPI0014394ABE|nr:type I-F CRISPR-associated protein Csy3 [Megasphaera sp. SW808]NJE35154.1 type I-F CRISPR-associated protein Csy3 [Megasphaera sp. SW808]